jgi:Tfp pilus assembly protein PilF
MLVDEVSASTQEYPYAAANLRAARLTNAAQVVQGYFTRNRDSLRVRAIVQNLGTMRDVAALTTDSGPHENMTSASLAIAAAIDKRTRPFGTQNADAIRAWGQAIVATNPAARTEALERSLKADPNFGTAYLDLVRVYLATGDNARAADVLKRADERLSQFTDLDRAKLEYAEGAVRQNEVQRREALTALSRLVSTDAETLHTLAQADVNGRQFGPAVDLYKSALAIEPDNAALWNELGYTESYRGNLDGARTALERYRALQPDQANPLDSLGEVHFFAGHFAEAETYFLDAQRRSPDLLGGADLVKAAQARFLAGNLAGADQLYGQFDGYRRTRRDPAVDVRKAEWLHITGRLPQAIAAAEAAAAGGNAEVAGYALCHLSMWALDAGDRGKAQDYVTRAGQTSHSPAIQRLIVLCRDGLESPELGAETGPDAAARRLGAAYARLYSNRAGEAAAILKPLYEHSSPPVDGHVRTLYAWALADSGQAQQARELVERYFIPLGSADEPMLTAQVFPRFLALRSRLSGGQAGSTRR